MANGIVAPTASGTILLTEQITDSALGITGGHKQFAAIMSGAAGSTNKMIVNSDGSINATVPSQTYGTYGQKVELATALNQAIDSVSTYPRGANYILLTASGSIITTPGKLAGFFVNSLTAGATLKIWDNTAASGSNIVIDTTTLTAAGQFVRLPDIRLTTAAYATITGTASISFFFDPTTT